MYQILVSKAVANEKGFKEYFFANELRTFPFSITFSYSEEEHRDKVNRQRKEI